MEDRVPLEVRDGAHPEQVARRRRLLCRRPRGRCAPSPPPGSMWIASATSTTKDLMVGSDSARAQDKRHAACLSHAPGIACNDPTCAYATALRAGALDATPAIASLVDRGALDYVPVASRSGLRPASVDHPWPEPTEPTLPRRPPPGLAAVGFSRWSAWARPRWPRGTPLSSRAAASTRERKAAPPARRPSWRSCRATSRSSWSSPTSPAT